MKVTKYNHSCILVEDQGKILLIDPGSYSEEIFPVTTLNQLDYIFVTHDHFDHFSIPLIKKLTAKFPHVKIIGTASVLEQLQKEAIQATTEDDENIHLEPVPHEKVWGVPKMSDNSMMTAFGKLSHPGDSLSFTHCADILCLPISGPWCNTTQAVELGEKLKPKVIIPIHDWHWKDEVRIGMYQRLAAYFGERGIDFKQMENGVAVEV